MRALTGNYGSPAWGGAEKLALACPFSGGPVTGGALLRVRSVHDEGMKGLPHTPHIWVQVIDRA